MLTNHSHRFVDLDKERQKTDTDRQQAFGCALEFVGCCGDVAV
jgi:hypothetical protein